MQHIIECPACHCNFTLSVAWPAARPPQPLPLPPKRQEQQRSRLPKPEPLQLRPHADLAESTKTLDEGLVAETRGELMHAIRCYKLG